jgi:hypothetical protein
MLITTTKGTQKDIPFLVIKFFKERNKNKNKKEKEKETTPTPSFLCAFPSLHGFLDRCKKANTPYDFDFQSV